MRARAVPDGGERRPAYINIIQIIYEKASERLLSGRTGNAGMIEWDDGGGGGVSANWFLLPSPGW